MTTAARPRLLLMSGASLVGQNLLAALDARRALVHLSALNSVADDPALFDFDTVWLAPGVRAEPMAFAHRFAQLVSEDAPDLIIPCRDDDIAWLAHWADAHPDWRPRVLCGAADLADMMLDKARSADWSEAHGLPFAPSIPASADPQALRAFAARHGYPLLFKPREGFASQGVRLLLDDAQVQRCRSRADGLVQRYLGDPAVVTAYCAAVAADGPPLFHSFEEAKISLQARIRPDGTVAATLATRHVMRLGRSMDVERCLDPDAHALATHCASVFAAAGWRGPLNIQCQRTPSGELFIYEYNGRFTGATAARRWLGFDEVGDTLADWLDWRACPLPGPAPAAPPETTAAVRKYAINRPMHPTASATLRRDGVWHAPRKTPA